MNCIGKNSPVRCSLAELFEDLSQTFLHPLRVWLIKSEVHVQRPIPWSCPSNFGGCGETEEVIQEYKKLEQELATEMSVSNLPQN